MDNKRTSMTLLAEGISQDIAEDLKNKILTYLNLNEKDRDFFICRPNGNNFKLNLIGELTAEEYERLYNVHLVEIKDEKNDLSDIQIFYMLRRKKNLEYDTYLQVFETPEEAYDRAVDIYRQTMKSSEPVRYMVWKAVQHGKNQIKEPYIW